MLSQTGFVAILGGIATGIVTRSFSAGIAMAAGIAAVAQIPRSPKIDLKETLRSGFGYGTFAPFANPDSSTEVALRPVTDQDITDLAALEPRFGFTLPRPAAFRGEKVLQVATATREGKTLGYFIAIGRLRATDANCELHSICLGHSREFYIAEATFVRYLREERGFTEVAVRAATVCSRQP